MWYIISKRLLVSQFDQRVKAVEKMMNEMVLP